MSEKFVITFSDGRIEEILGLKSFALSNNIPYVTLHKAYKDSVSIRKYNISNISAV